MTAHEKKLTNAEDREVWRPAQTGRYTQKALALRFGVSDTTISGIVHNRLYRSAWETDEQEPEREGETR